MPVAKSYQAMEIIEGPYSLNGRQYVKVNNGKNTIKQVRWYSEAEYKIFSNLDLILNWRCYPYIYSRHCVKFRIFELLRWRFLHHPMPTFA